MKRTRVLLALTAGAALVALPLTRAADHTDGPLASQDPTADIADVYAWMSSDARHVNLVMTAVRDARPGQQFSNQVQYVFHTSSKTSFGAQASTDTDVICEVDGGIRCWVGGDEFVGGPVDNPAGATSSSGRVRVFAGLRSDPFFFNLRGFQATSRAVVSAAPSLGFDPAGCPRLDAATAGALGTLLTTTDGGPVLSVWGATHRRS